MEADDILLLVDLQNDFILPEGSLYVQGGDELVDQIISLINQFDRCGANIILTRDYHPINHHSFRPMGLFPPHCVWGQFGSQIEKNIASCILQCHTRNKIKTAFKGINENIDSFTAIECGDEPWTGSFITHDLNLIGYPEQEDSSLYFNTNNIKNCQSLSQFSSIIGGEMLSSYFKWIMKPHSNIYVCGLAGDFCVLDTAINLKKLLPTSNVKIVDNCVRYVSTHRQKQVNDKFNQYGIHLVNSLLLHQDKDVKISF